MRELCATAGLPSRVFAGCPTVCHWQCACQGKGAAKARIEEGRRLFPSIWFDEDKCMPGLDALGWYHEKKDEVRNIGLGPEHDWASHGADAFGLMCVAYQPEQKEVKMEIPKLAGGWMGR